VRSLQADHLFDVASSHRHTVKPWFEGKLDFAPPVRDWSAEGFELLGGRMDYLGGRAVAALVYRHRKHVINVFVWPEPGADESARVEVIDGFNVVQWRREGMACRAVSDLSADELAKLAQLTSAGP
jgi:anti-sigma factor RsiW